MNISRGSIFVTDDRTISEITDLIGAANEHRTRSQPDRATRRRVLAGVAATSVLASCGPLDRLNAVPTAPTDDVSVIDLRDIRYWVDEASPLLIQEGLASFQRELAYRKSARLSGPPPDANFLAISGGGEDGAFGAGLLVGWTAAGTGPTVKLVTGISTGALSAPFAFMGSSHEPQLVEV
jgi:hypothetical protein